MKLRRSSVCYVYLTIATWNTVAADTVAAPTLVDKLIPVPSSSSNPIATSESILVPASKVASPATPPTEPGVSATEMSPATIVAPPVANVKDCPPPVDAPFSAETETVIDKPVEIVIPLAVVVERPKSTLPPVMICPSPVVSLA